MSAGVIFVFFFQFHNSEVYLLPCFLWGKRLIIKTCHVLLRKQRLVVYAFGSIADVENCLFHGVNASVTFAFRYS